MIRTLAIAAAAAATLAAPAHADSTDNAYLAALNSHGIQGDPAALISSGHDACNAGGGPLNYSMLGVIAGLTAQGLSQHQASTAILAAYSAYCPDRLPAGLNPIH